MSIAGVTRELLVRYLDAWTPAALHTARRATYVHAADADVETAEAALRVFAEFADRLRTRRLTMVVVGARAADAGRRLEAVQGELRTPSELSVHPVPGAAAELLPVAVRAAGAAGAPLLVYFDSDAGGPATDVIGVGKPTELILSVPPAGWADTRRALREGGFPLTAGVELVDGEASRLLGFGTLSAKNLETFKNALWAVDEYAGVRFRDPRDPERHLLDISLNPDPGPLRRQLQAYLAASGACSVTDLRRFTLTETVYRSADTTRALTALLTAGTVSRDPEQGRLSGDVIIAPPTR